ncbi:hypothetical protein [Arthrobacter sp. NPDC057259]|uniref:hypothetical protein n=1 Tax=Arthrobacter sp. NPDC057259 TaxID=3346073 RepID=UPI00364096A9
MSHATRTTTHQLVVDAPAELVFSLLSAASHWPDLDGVTVYAEQIGGDERDNEVRISFAVDGALMSTHFRRLIDAEERSIRFQHSGPDTTPYQVSGSWHVDLAADDPTPGPGASVVTLVHEYLIEEGSEEVWAEEIFDEYARRELAALRRSCERLQLLQRHFGR